MATPQLSFGQLNIINVDKNKNFTGFIEPITTTRKQKHQTTLLTRTLLMPSVQT
jgi:hypothetical protein